MTFTEQFVCVHNMYYTMTCMIFLCHVVCVGLSPSLSEFCLLCLLQYLMTG